MTTTTTHMPNLQKHKTERPNLRSSSSSGDKREKGWNNRFILGKIQDYNIYENQYYLSMKLNQEHSKFFQQTKTELQAIQQRQCSSTGFSGNNKTPDSKSFNAQIEDDEGNNSIIHRIRILWNELGVVEDFRLLFGLVAEQLDDTNREDFIRNEIDSLEYLALLLETITNDIHQRKSLINTIKQRDIDIGYSLQSSNNDNKVDDSLIDEVIAKMQLVRKTTISIIQSMTKIRENCAYSILGGKFDLTRLAKKYHFDKNYLIKMKDQLDFLKTSHLSHFFNFIEGDPFLLQPSEQKTAEGKVVPLNEDMLLEIKRCNAKGHIFRSSSPSSSIRGNGTKDFKHHNGVNTWMGRHKDHQNISKYNKGAITSMSNINYPELNSNNFSSNSRTDFAKKGSETGKNSSSISSPLANQGKQATNTINRKIQTLDKNSKGSMSTQNMMSYNNSKIGTSIRKDMEKKISYNDPLAKVANKRKDRANNDLLNPINKKQSNAKGRIINENSNEEESKEEVIKSQELKVKFKEKKEDNNNQAKQFPYTHKPTNRGKANIQFKEIKKNKTASTLLDDNKHKSALNKLSSREDIDCGFEAGQNNQNRSMINKALQKDNSNDQSQVLVYQDNEEEVKKENNNLQSHYQSYNLLQKEDDIVNQL